MFSVNLVPLIDNILQSSSEFVNIWLSTKDQNELDESSKKGVRLLKDLAVTIRQEQDARRFPDRNSDKIGFQVDIIDINNWDIEVYKHGNPITYNVPLRKVMNGIAHFDRSLSSFYADNNVHRLILIGEDTSHRKYVVTVFDIVALCTFIKSI